MTVVTVHDCGKHLVGNLHQVRGGEALESERGQASSDFADRLNRLVATTRQADGSAWTNAAVARAVTELGTPTGPSNISLLRSGQRTNPSAALVGALAEVFDVPTDYFFSRTAEEWERELKAVTTLRRAGVRSVAARAAKLSDDSLDKLTELADYLARLENLED